MRISGRFCWNTSVIVLACANLIPAQAVAADRYDLRVALVLAQDQAIVSIANPLEKSGCVVKDAAVGRTVEAEVIPALKEKFSDVVLASSADAPEGVNADLVLVPRWQNFSSDFGEKVGKDAKIKFDIEVTGFVAGAPVFSVRKNVHESFDWSWGMFSNYECADFRRESRKFAETTVARTLLKILGDKEATTALANVMDEKQGGAQNLLAGLQAMDAKYRVTNQEGTVRRKPDAKTAMIKKFSPGSQLQVIGRLPTGWLQVAKEGEAIGWIHEGSVTAMNAQQAITVAAAPAAPAKPVAVSPAPTLAAAPAAETFPTKPVAVSFPRGKAAPDDIAVIIGNANYKATAKDIPDVVPAYADAEGMKRYATQALGIREENVIFIKDAKLIDLISTFGTADDPKGKLFNWVKPGQSNVFVFYSGHGAPSADGASSYLVPVDAQAALINLSGYSLKALYANLGKLPAKSVTVVLEACFSGASQSGMLMKNASPIYQKAMAEIVPANLTVISAGSGNQIASWEQDKSHGLFTKHYLLGMAGAADKKPYGNGDGKVGTDELAAYLKGTMSYMAQRYYGREQTVQVATGTGR